MREIAGIAVYRKISQAEFAKRYTKRTGRKGMTPGNISKHFSDGSAGPRTLRHLADVVGMTDLHLRLVSEWPALLPPSGNLALAIPFLEESLGLKEMRHLYTDHSGYRVLDEVAEALKNDAALMIKTVNKVNLECERVFARGLYGKDRDQMSAWFGVTRQTSVRFKALRAEMDGRFDLTKGLANRTEDQESKESAFLKTWAALSSLTISLEEWEDDDANEMPHSPSLTDSDVVAIMEITRRLAFARGLNVQKMDDRLERDPRYSAWLYQYHRSL